MGHFAPRGGIFRAPLAGLSQLQQGANARIRGSERAVMNGQ